MLYLVRHGIALDCGQDGIDSDAERPLSPKGWKRTELSAKGLLALDAVPDVLATSPLLRARQTADIIASVMAPELTPRVTEALTPGASPVKTVEWLQTITETNVMLVGHLPNLADVAALLLGGHCDLDIQLRKASACCLSCYGEWHPGTGRLEWLLQPSQLRLLAQCSDH